MLPSDLALRRRPCASPILADALARQARKGDRGVGKLLPLRQALGAGHRPFQTETPPAARTASASHPLAQQPQSGQGFVRPAASNSRPCLLVVLTTHISVLSAARSCRRAPRRAPSCHGGGGLPKTPGTKRPEWMSWGSGCCRSLSAPGPAAHHNRSPWRCMPTSTNTARRPVRPSQAQATPRPRSRLSNFLSICPSVSNTASCPVSARHFPHDLWKADPQNRDASLSLQGRLP